MARFSLTLLGNAACELDGQAVRFARRSGLAVAVYIVLAGRVQSRSALASLIAGESDEAGASMALRNALRDLRAALGDHLVVDTRTVALAPSLELATDVAAFEAAAQAGLDQGSLTLLREAAGGYGGEFARGLALRGAPELDEWLQRERERLRDLYLRVLEGLAAAEERAGDRKGAIDTARRLLAEEPWREETHRSLIRLLAADGQRAAALLQFEQCREALGRELGVEPQPETLALYEQLQAGPVAPPHNLPARPTTFVDRPAERALLAEQLRRPDCRLVTIVGIGGAGKTRLALELATEFTRPGLPDELAFPDGVCLLTCAEADRAAPASTEQLSLTLLRILNLTVAPTTDPEDVLLRWLAPRALLLIVDNAESEPAAAAFASAILAAAPRVRLLVTSRVRLRLQAEWVFDVGGLTLPMGADDLPGSEAGQLFLERARAVRLRHPLAVSDYPHIARICRLVNGLPLGIVLAAGRLRALSCAEIADQLETDLGLLVSEAPDLPERQRSLGAVLRWSYNQLRPDEARCLRLLAVVRGDFDLRAARAIGCGGPAVLEALADSGLLAWNGGRYSLHPLVQHTSARELAGSADERTQAEERHADYFVGLAAGLCERIAQNEGAAQELVAHWDNLLVAWRWAVARRRPAHLARLRPALAHVWDSIGLFRDGITYCGGAAVALGYGVDPDALAPPDAAEAAELLLVTAWFHSRIAELDRAVALLGEARRYAARGASEGLLERIDHQQGVQLYLQTRYDAARPLLERSLALALQRGDRRGELDALSVLARLAHRAGDSALMQSVVESAERRFGDRFAALEMDYIRFAAAHLQVDLHGDVAPAHALLARHGRASAVEHHQIQYWRWSLEWFVACAEGRFGRAEELMRQGVERAEELRNGFVPIVAAVQLADAVLAQGGAAEADQLYLGALQRARVVGAPYLHTLALLGRARVAEQRGAYARALALADEALALVRDEGNRRLISRALVVRAHALAGLGRHAEASGCYMDAFACDMAVGHSARVVAGATALAEMRRAQGDLAGAIQLIAPLITSLLHGELTGMDEPVRTLLSAAATLRSAGDPRAEPLVEQARRELERRAGLVRPERRDAFLHDIPAHRALAVDAPATLI